MFKLYVYCTESPPLPEVCKRSYSDQVSKYKMIISSVGLSNSRVSRSANLCESYPGMTFAHPLQCTIIKITTSVCCVNSYDDFGRPVG